jgi:hypothetical protein
MERRGVDRRPAFGRGKAKNASRGAAGFINETHFSELIGRERKRAQRSGRIMVLMRLDISELMNSNPAHTHRALQTAFESGIRDTDVCGWCKRDSIAGILFTDIESASPGVQRILFRRVIARLGGRIDPDALRQVKATLLIYPEDGAQAHAVDCIGMEWHDDLVKCAVQSDASSRLIKRMKAACNLLMA